jgi:hypothetical protein
MATSGEFIAVQAPASSQFLQTISELNFSTRTRLDLLKNSENFCRKNIPANDSEIRGRCARWRFFYHVRNLIRAWRAFVPGNDSVAMNFFSWDTLQGNDPDPGLLVHSHHLYCEWWIGFAEIVGQEDKTRFFTNRFSCTENGMAEATRLILVDARCTDSRKELIEVVKQLPFPLGCEPGIEVSIGREISANAFFIPTNNKNYLFDTRSDGFLNDVLSGWSIYDQQEFFRYCFRDR